jgi:hypothetical protein
MRPVSARRRFHASRQTSTMAVSSVLRDNLDERRIASLKMLLGVELLPHLICSRPAWGGGDKDEAGEHDDAERVGNSGC